MLAFIPAKKALAKGIWLKVFIYKIQLEVREAQKRLKIASKGKYITLNKVVLPSYG